jgi:hypothetical protein
MKTKKTETTPRERAMARIYKAKRDLYVMIAALETDVPADAREALVDATDALARAWRLMAGTEESAGAQDAAERTAAAQRAGTLTPCQWCEEYVFGSQSVIHDGLPMHRECAEHLAGLPRHAPEGREDWHADG